MFFHSFNLYDNGKNKMRAPTKANQEPDFIYQ